jgi:hypothetical protein
MMRRRLMFTLFAALLWPAGANAREPIELRGRIDAAAVPVVEIMRIVSWRRAAFDQTIREYTAPSLQRFYTARFRNAYREARRVIREAEDPFVTDPIIGGQDSCALDDIRFEIERTTARQQTVYVSFRAAQCMSGTPEERQTKTTTVFHVVRQSGIWRIDDIVLKGVSFRQGLIDGAARVKAREREERKR